jgi:hypothetical protein
MYQLRIYTIADGKMDEFLASMGPVLELRRQHGFDVRGPWIIPEAGQYVWIAGYGGPEGFEAAVERYYHAPERQSLDPEPGDLLVDSDVRMMEPS